MKISVNGVELFTLSDIKENVIKNDINADIFDEDMSGRLIWALMHKYEQCFKRLKAEWDIKLSALGVEAIPTDPDAYAELVFARPEYKDRKARELESQE